MEYRGWQNSWARLNPGFEYRLWTDRDLDALVEERFPHLLALYRGYRHPICRVDLGRYLVLKTFGGVYADLDCECLRPIDDLLVVADFAIGLEPESHVALGKAVDRGLSRILCPSFIASIPDHPFWDHVLDYAAAAGGEADILDATGPFLLTRAYQDFPDRSQISLLSPDLVYPVDKQECATGRTFDIEFWERATRRAYVVHYWAGSWWRRSGISGDLPRDFTVRVINDRAGGMMPPAALRSAPPKISCMMLTGDRTELAKRSIRGFLDQSHADRELVIVDTGRDDALEETVRGMPNVRLLRPGRQRVPQHSLYLQAAEAAAGDFLCFWDDHCLHDPQRLEFQWTAIETAAAEASLIVAPMIWQPLEDRIFVARPQKWANSLLCDKSLFHRYFGNGATAARSVDRLLNESRIAGIDIPRLLLVTIDKADVQHRQRWDVAWNFARRQYAGLHGKAVLAELSKRLPLEDHPLRFATPVTHVCLDLFGRMSAASGLGSAARSTQVALTSAGIPVRVHDIEFHDADVRIPFAEGPPAAKLGDGGTRINLVHANPETLAEGLAGGFPSLHSVRDRFTIGYWVWEAARIPARWRPLLPLVDEIWVPSNFVAQMIAPDLPVPVVVMPHAVDPPRPERCRSELGLPSDRFLFLFLFDALSTLERKNPIGLIQSYLTAFPEASDRTMLVIKTKDLDPDDRGLLESAIGARTDILLIEESYTAERTASLIAACDCYVSLHRAEGFGLSIAEAMYFGKPVIATGHSGNMDFMAPDRSYPVAYRMQEIAEPRSGFPAGTRWAEPDLAAAAKIMRQVVDRPGEAQERGRRGALWVRTHLSPEAVGARMKARISALTVSGRIQQVRLPRPVACSVRKSGPPRGSGGRVLILTPVKNAEIHLPRYFALLERLEYDPAQLSAAFLEGDSSDRSFAMLNAWAEGAGRRLRRVSVLKHDFDYRLSGLRWDPVVQRQRREILARSRNRLLTALDDEDWVLWLDADLVDYPPDLLARLLAAGKDIVVPHSRFPNGRTFDLNSFRIDPSRGGVEDPRYLLDGLFQPPRGEGRLYTDAFRDEPLAPLDSVGGTALLVRADLHREGLIFPPFGYRGYIETEGLAMMAKDMGVTPFALPDVSITHAASSPSQES